MNNLPIYLAKYQITHHILIFSLQVRISGMWIFFYFFLFVPFFAFFFFCQWAFNIKKLRTQLPKETRKEQRITNFPASLSFFIFFLAGPGRNKKFKINKRQKALNCIDGTIKDQNLKLSTKELVLPKKNNLVKFYYITCFLIRIYDDNIWATSETYIFLIQLSTWNHLLSISEIANIEISSLISILSFIINAMILSCN